MYDLRKAEKGQRTVQRIGIQKPIDPARINTLSKLYKLEHWTRRFLQRHACCERAVRPTPWPVHVSLGLTLSDNTARNSLALQGACLAATTSLNSMPPHHAEREPVSSASAFALQHHPAKSTIVLHSSLSTARDAQQR